MMVEKGFTDDQIKTEILSHPDGVGERYLSGKKSLDQEIARARKKVARGTSAGGTVDVLPTEEWHEDQAGLPQEFVRHQDGRIFTAVKVGKDWSLALCSSMRILARTANNDFGEWGLLVEVEAPDGTMHQVTIPAADLHVSTGDRDPLQLLASAGLRFFSPRYKGLVRDLLMTAEPEKILRSVKTPGWHGRAFAFAD
jgi:Domain of unknown function (DUF927)